VHIFTLRFIRNDLCFEQNERSTHAQSSHYHGVTVQQPKEVVGWRTHAPRFIGFASYTVGLTRLKQLKPVGPAARVGLDLAKSRETQAST
jgi:hypothetical protein